MAATISGLLIAMFGPMLLAVASTTLAGDAAGPTSSLLGLGALVAILASVLWIVIHHECRSLMSIGLRPFGWRSVAWGLALAAFFMYVFAPVAGWVLARLGLGGFEPGIARFVGLPAWYLTIAVVLGGAAEEVLYRGYAVERIAGLTGSYWLAGTVSVSLFGLAHVPMWGWGPALSTLVSGTIVTLFFIWRRDLLANIIGHVVTDLAGLVIFPRLAQTVR
jgi:membrane protease YdiL (CAAX protease family)